LVINWRRAGITDLIDGDPQSAAAKWLSVLQNESILYFLTTLHVSMSTRTQGSTAEDL